MRAVFQNADRALTPGLFVRLQMPGRAAGTGVLIRDEAVGTEHGNQFAEHLEDNAADILNPDRRQLLGAVAMSG